MVGHHEKKPKNPKFSTSKSIFKPIRKFSRLTPNIKKLTFEVLSMCKVSAKSENLFWSGGRDIGFFFTRFFGFLKITNVSGFLQKFKLYQVQCIRLTKKCIRFFYQVVKLYQGGKYQVFEIFDFLPGRTLKFSALRSAMITRIFQTK